MSVLIVDSLDGAKGVQDSAVYVNVEPQVLDWAITTSGWKKDDLLKRLKISEQTFEGWRNKESSPTIKQVELLSELVKRPLAVFLLDKPPIEKPLPKDYRQLPNKEGEFEKKTLLAIRKARRLQALSKELLENVNATPQIQFDSVDINTQPEKIALEYRKLFGIDENSAQIKSSRQLFNFLRDTLEEKNIFVFQIAMPVEDARGFCLVDDLPAVIVVNTKDTIEARTFTLVHELGHVLLRESEIDLPEKALYARTTNPAEKWCNEFASTLLLPKELAKQIFATHEKTLTETKTLNTLSTKYFLSKAMLVYNMNKLGFISKEIYDSVMRRYDPTAIIAPTKTTKKGKFGITQDKKCFSEKGQKFVSLVASNIEKGYITHYDALDYLSVKSNKLEKVMKGLKK
ncbi:MAG: ImmA/IrrE family metallo-endopeptidase [archaeon]